MPFGTNVEAPYRYVYHPLLLLKLLLLLLLQNLDRFVLVQVGHWMEAPKVELVPMALNFFTLSLTANKLEHLSRFNFCLLQQQHSSLFAGCVSKKTVLYNLQVVPMALNFFTLSLTANKLEHLSLFNFCLL
jgi:hypothetical protein